MYKQNKIQNIFSAILMILTAVLMIILESLGGGAVFLIMFVLSIWLIAYGVRLLFYYSKMARHMVGGKIFLIFGVITFDFGIFNLTLSDEHRVFIILYLLGIYAFAGFVDIMRGLEQKKHDAPHWKYKIVEGVLDIMVVIAAFVSGFFFKSPFVLIVIFASGLIYSAINRIVDTFRKDNIVTSIL